MKTLATELAELAEKMKDIGAKMESYAGFDVKQAERGQQLVNSSVTVQRWADDLIDKAKH